LIDPRAASHIQAEKYDRLMKDIFALEDEVAIKVFKAKEKLIQASFVAGLESTWAPTAI